jgi:hypothetical protein
VSEQPERAPNGTFAAGNSGRPKGSRNKLGEAFIKAMMEDFEKHGVATITLARMEDPLGYVKVVAGLLPKELTGENGEPLFAGITVNFVKPGTNAKS